MSRTRAGRSLVAVVALMGILSVQWVSGSASAAEPEPDGALVWQWVPEEGTCDEPVSMDAVRMALDSAPAMIVGFEHRAALAMLRDWAVRVRCLDAPASPRFLADLWYQIGMASLYTWDELGALNGRGRDEVLAIFSKVQALVPDYTWDTTSFGTFGRTLWESAGKKNAGAGTVEVVVPQVSHATKIWVDGRPVDPRAGRLKVIPGTCLVQVRSRKRLEGRWWVAVPGGPPATLPVEPSGHPDRIRAPMTLSLLGGGWAFPLLYTGPSVYLHIPVKAHLEWSIGTGAARMFGPEVDRWIVPVQAGLWWRSSARRLGWELGVGYQGYLGGGFAAAPGDTGGQSDAPDWLFDPQTGWTTDTAAFAAHGAALLGLIELNLGPWRVELRGSGGMAVWPGVMVSPQIQVAAGVGRRFGKEGAR